MRYELSDYEWTAIKPMLPNKPRGVRRVNDRRVLNGIFWVLRSGAPWRDLPESYGPRTTCYNRFVRWRRVPPLPPSPPPHLTPHVALTPGEAHDNRLFGPPQRPASTHDVTRGSGLRRRLDQGACPPAGSMGEHSAETKSQGPNLLQPLSVSRPQPDRTVLQQDQAMSACRDPIRQTRSQLSGVRQTRFN